MPEHIHRHEHDHAEGNDKTGRHDDKPPRRITIRAKGAPGLICIERNIHDEAIVISGSLTVEYGAVDLSALVAEELERAARAVVENSGIVGHIKSALTISSTKVVSVTDDKAVITEAPLKRAKITLAAILFMIEPEIAEDIVRKALAGVRSASRRWGAEA